MECERLAETMQLEEEVEIWSHGGRMRLAHVIFLKQQMHQHVTELPVPSDSSQLFSLLVTNMVGL